MKLHFVLLGCLACGIASVYASPTDESDALVQQIGKYPSLVKAIQKLVRYVISKPAQLQNDDENDDMVTVNNAIHLTQSDEDVTQSDEDVTQSDEDVTQSHEDASVTNEDASVTSEDVTQSDEDVTQSDEDVSVTSEDVSVTSEDVSVTSEDASVTSEDASVTIEDASVTSEAADEDDDTKFGFDPFKPPIYGECTSAMILQPLWRDNCFNNAWLRKVGETLNNLTGTVANKTDFEISIYTAALDEYFRLTFDSKQGLDTSYKLALLKTLKTYYYDDSRHRVQGSNATLSKLRNGISSLTKKIDKECRKNRSPGVKCHQVVLRWYRGVIKACPQYKDVMKLHQEIGTFRNEWNKVESEIFKSVVTETGPRTFALTQRKYGKMLSRGAVLYSSIFNANIAHEKCKGVLEK